MYTQPSLDSALTRVNEVVCREAKLAKVLGQVDGWKHSIDSGKALLDRLDADALTPT